MTKTTSDCTITIDVNGVGFGSVSVDGTEIKSVQAVSVAIAANEAPAVNLRLAVRERAQLRCEGAVLVVDDVVMPASVEMALWRYLNGKYAKEIDVTTLSSTARERALRDR
ncbi:hypothetical protein [Paraburkholderia xenovorans]|uniref:hypothetical protein n=1 Tax=Paraburkholderia xenovorans TaxID=36873 RepID=UPI0015C56570|nr:hypothetical protein [Paraburkholderia xenovorans]NPT38552.1 hypothetical protein [Paraburkholderia xenovorans]